MNGYFGDPIRVEQFERAIVIKFSRPESRNPLSTRVLSRIESTLSELVDDEDRRSLVFTGTNSGFASGADLNEIAALAGDNVREFARRGQMLMSLIEDHPSDTFAAINGFCFGGALDLALSCRNRIASPNATFCHPGVGLGIITGWAMEMFLTAEPIKAPEALRIGLVDKIVDDPLAEALNR